MIRGRSLQSALLFALCCGLLWGGCKPSPGGWGRVRILASHLEPTSWTVVVADQGQGVELFVDGSPKQGQCRRGGQGIRCWIGGLRPGYHRLAVTVPGKGTARRSALSAKRRPVDEVFYGVLLDRFSDGDTANNLRVNREDPMAAHGGDLRGLRKRLAHLKRLGVTTLVVSPIWEASRVKTKPPALPHYVGARPVRAAQLSRALGKPRALMRLLRSARRRGLRVVLDLPRTGRSLVAYVAMVRTWLTRTFADGVRLGPFRPGEETAWAAASARLSSAFTPLLLVHHGTGDRAKLRRALSGLPVGARLMEGDSTGRALFAWTGGKPPAADLTGPVGRGRVRVLSDHRAPVLVRRMTTGPMAERRAGLVLTLHLLLAEIPQVYYADEIPDPPRTQRHPDLDWSEVKGGPRQRLLRKILGLRRGVKALRQGQQRVVNRGEVLLVGRSHEGCRVIVAANRSDKPQRLTVDTTALGWPPQTGAVELVDRLKGRGYTLVKNQLTIELKPASARVLVPAGSGACSG